MSTPNRSQGAYDPHLIARWRKSSRSNAALECVEVAFVPGLTAIRDSKNPSGPALSFDPAGWRNFLSAIKSGDFDAR